MSQDFCSEGCGGERGGRGEGVPTGAETLLRPTSLSRCLGGDLFRCVFGFRARTEAFGGRDEPFVMRDEELVTRAKELVTRDEDLVTRTK